ncbi:Hsp33 family molecular chaperone HslO [Alloiococcus otitis]|uniref:Hsp33 family molecular chaperone HslO n=1 Tax=Alloiococcus otitis TaxID=1652 RepID=UPI002354DD02|nr:Hsp33 family molecular chaperone HslO [Alloiococcus otitis]
MADKLLKALAYNDEIRIYVADATDMVAEAQRRHDTWNTATAALGRAMIGTSLLAAGEKGDVFLTVRIEGNGPAGYLLVDGNAKGDIKAYIQNPHVSLPLNDKGKLDVKGAIGDHGSLTVTKDIGMREPFVGQVPLISGELGEDFTFYLANSEQIASSVGLSVLVDTDDTVRTAGGFMIQVLPGASPQTIDQLEATIQGLPLISKMMDKGKSPEELLSILAGHDNYRIVDEMDIQFKCNCSKERFANSLVSLGEEDIKEMIEEDGGAEAVCHFCRQSYQFSKEDLEEILEEMQDA